MRLTGKCKKCGSDCSPKWQRATDQMRYECACGYGWSSAPLDSPVGAEYRIKEFKRAFEEARDRFDVERERDPPLKVYLSNGTGRGEINLR